MLSQLSPPRVRETRRENEPKIYRLGFLTTGQFVLYNETDIIVCLIMSYIGSKVEIRLEMFRYINYKIMILVSNIIIN